MRFIKVIIQGGTMSNNPDEKLFCTQDIIDRTITSLDKANLCNASPNFTKSVMNKIYDLENQKEYVHPFNLNVKLAYTMVFFLIFINTAAIIFSTNSINSKKIVTQNNSSCWIGVTRETLLDDILLADNRDSRQ